MSYLEAERKHDDGTPHVHIIFTMDPSNPVLKTGFKPIFQDGVIAKDKSSYCSTAQMALKAGSDPHGVTVTPTSISITKTVQLAFTIVSQDPGISYYPTGLSTKQANGSSDPAGRLTFPEGWFGQRDKVWTQTIKVLADNTHTYNFLISIERSTDGAFGVIDPVIINSG